MDWLKQVKTEQANRLQCMPDGATGAPPKALSCPSCHTDVMITGWTETAVRTRSYMRFRGRGAVLIATTVNVADKATCMACGRVLALPPVEIQRLA